MATPATSPSDYTSLRLDTRHAQNFRLMLRSLRLAAGLNTLGGSQGTMNAAPGSAPVQRTLEGLQAEAKPFEPIAYGATLGLVYYRALGTTGRQLWDAAIDRQLSQAMTAHAGALQAQRSMALQLATNSKVLQQPDWLASRQNNAQTIQNFARYADFLATLREKKRAVFPTSTEGALNDPKVIGQNPWCLGTRPEFTSAYKQVKGAPANAHPAFYSGRPDEKESLEQNASKMFGVAVEAKTVEYLSAFLEKGSEALLRGSLREGMSYVCRFPVVDVLVDWLKDKIAADQLRALQQLYDDDMERRRLLYSYHWAVSPEPDLDEITPADRRAYGAQR